MKTSFWTRILDLISPRQCVICGERLSITERAVCSSCYLHLPRTTYQFTPYDNPMAQLFWGLAPISRAAALFFYEPHAEAAQLIYDLKYADRPDIGEDIGRMMAEEMQMADYFAGVGVIIPVPLSSKRKRQRGYNQSEMIARGISQETSITVLTDAVTRLHFSESQTHLDRWERLKNVEQQFQAPNPASLSGKHVLLVDDVTTSGATIIACASALHPKQHQIRFSVLTLGFTHS